MDNIWMVMKENMEIDNIELKIIYFKMFFRMI